MSDVKSSHIFLLFFLSVGTLLFPFHLPLTPFLFRALSQGLWDASRGVQIVCYEFQGIAILCAVSHHSRFEIVLIGNKGAVYAYILGEDFRSREGAMTTKKGHCSPLELSI